MKPHTPEAKPVFTWVTVDSKDEMENFYRSVMKKITEAARLCGYAIGVHGSMRRDLDLIAVPWVAEYKNIDQLATAIHIAACGASNKEYQWEKKPNSRLATCFPICFPSWDEPSLGYIDLSVIELNPDYAEKLSASEETVALLKLDVKVFTDQVDGLTHANAAMKKKLAIAVDRLKEIKYAHQIEQAWVIASNALKEIKDGK
jgi:hypothetical protein